MLKLILNSNLGLVLFRQKQALKFTRHKNLQKQNNEDFYSVVEYLVTFYQQQTSYPYIYRRNPWSNNIFQATHQTGI